MKFQLDAHFAVLGSHHQGSVVKFFVRFSIDMTIGRYIRHYLEISLMLLYTLNLAISGTKVSLFQWTLSHLDTSNTEICPLVMIFAFLVKFLATR